MFFKKRTSEEDLAELAPYINKKVKEKVNSDSYVEKIQIEADISKIKNLLEVFESLQDEGLQSFQEEMNSIISNKKSNRIHLISCISAYMAYFEKNGGIPKTLKHLTSCQLVLAIYWVCILFDDNFYK